MNWRRLLYVLGIETSTSVCCIGIAENRTIVADHCLNEGSQHAERLISMVEQALSATGLGFDALAGIAVGSGPGSFTGLRIGMATAKGLCLATGLPLLTIPTLEAIAFPHLENRVPVCALLDARRDQVYAGVYSLVDQVPRPLMADAALPLDELIPLLPKPVMFAGQGAHVYWDQILSRMGRDAELAPELPVGGSIAVLGTVKVGLGDFAQVAQVEPNYLRPSQAERMRAYPETPESAKIG
ncbi:MAG: tRNA (adenosine(37)-N6)-threonylcarbamoyltransferase complex dimerization subunit type 1 TsaB [Gemmatimonadetes bacterium]|nr:tRNA (adenosine(37)-N6)-threonylcarbamoyltransferase complex dimerization subunit type 1 TsaB [Gemmatimonadota bacterium]